MTKKDKLTISSALINKGFIDVPLFYDTYGDENGNIIIITKTGGFNIMSYYTENLMMEKLGTFIRCFDHGICDPYRYYEYSILPDFKDDYEYIISGRVENVSQKLKHLIKQINEQTYSRLFG